jgi:endonuclease/exonuclease/phosphatase family metal-dependent hydrolase
MEAAMTRHGIRHRFLSIAVLLLVGIPATSWGQQQVRVASYNIKFLSTNVQTQGDRLQKLRQVIDLLDADVIGLQEIDDRAALNLVFPPADWQVIIDDDSGVNQDVAIAVRRPFALSGFDATLDADDEHFLFPGSTENQFFPNRRDVLFAEIQVPSTTSTFFVLVVHAKSRLEGRAITDFRREEAARLLVQTLEQRFHERDFVLLGDFNDNPDDRSLNILETGDPNAVGGAEETAGPFLINLMESLAASDRVSHGRNTANIVGGLIDTVDPGSRARNNDHRGDNTNTGDILFDQLLIPLRMLPKYVGDSAQVFNLAVAAAGNDTTRASDHLPVSAEFTFGAPEPDAAAEGLRITGLLPDPAGNDQGNEQVTIRNSSLTPINLTGWRLRDRAQNEFILAGPIAAGATSTITMTAFTMPLNNSGDLVQLIDPQGVIRHEVRYEAAQVQPGVVVQFP